MRVVVGTRGSELALKQTQIVIEALSRISPGTEFVTETIGTHGDRSQRASLIGDGWFVKEIQQALLERRIDLAVHSLKDLPTEEVDGLSVAAVLARADARDVLVGGTLASLPSGATVGTGSPRRTAQLRAQRSDLNIVPLRGNVPTRIEKVRGGAIDAAVLAAAGLSRLSLLHEAQEFLAVEEFVPAPGQGAIAVEARADNSNARGLCGGIDDGNTRRAVEIERAVLRGVGGGCLLPFGAYAMVASHIRLIARLQNDDRDARVDLEGDDPDALIEEAIEKLR